MRAVTHMTSAPSHLLLFHQSNTPFLLEAALIRSSFQLMAAATWKSWRGSTCSSASTRCPPRPWLGVLGQGSWAHLEASWLLLPASGADWRSLCCL